MPYRARIADSKLHAYEDTIAATVEILKRIEPVLRRAIERQDTADIQELLLAGLAANFIRQHQITNMNNERNGRGKVV